MGKFLRQSFLFIFAIVAATGGQASEWDTWSSTSSLDVDTVTQPSPQTDTTCTTVQDSLTPSAAEATPATITQASYAAPLPATDSPAAVSTTECIEGETSTVTLTSVNVNTATTFFSQATYSPAAYSDTSVSDLSVTTSATAYSVSWQSNSTPTQVSPASQTTPVRPAVYTGAAGQFLPERSLSLAIFALFLFYG